MHPDVDVNYSEAQCGRLYTVHDTNGCSMELVKHGDLVIGANCSGVGGGVDSMVVVRNGYRLVGLMANFTYIPFDPDKEG